MKNLIKFLFKQDRYLSIIGLVTLWLVLFKIFFLKRIYIIEDEAYYWFWSNHLSWGYPEHPPMIAWMIYLGKNLFGDHAYGIRMGGILFFGFLSLLMYDWGRRIKDERTGIILFWLIHLIPFYAGASLINLPDTFLIIFLFLTSYFYYLAFFFQARYFFPAGISFGFSLLAKLTALHLGLAIFLFVLFSPKRRSYLASIKMWVSFLIAFLIFSPYLIWNTQNGFPTLVNLEHHLNRSTGFSRFFSFWMEQVVLYLPIVVFLISAMAVKKIRTVLLVRFKKWMADFSSQKNQQIFFLLLISWVPLAYFFYQSFSTPLRINWLSGGLIGFTVLTALLIASFWSVFKKIYTLYAVIFTMIFSLLLFFLSGDDSKGWLGRSFKQIYPSYTYYLRTYYEYRFFDQIFSKYYREEIDPTIPILSKGYQIPSAINYYVRPKLESFGWADRETYHLMTYYFLPQLSDYLKTLSNRYYYLGHSGKPDLAGFGFDPNFQTIEKIKTFDTYPGDATISVGYDLYLIKKK